MENKFNQKVYQLVCDIPCGKVATYGQIAAMLNKPHHARQVGYALHKNPTPYKIPCHRVVFKNGSLASSFAFGGEQAQKQLLTNEGITFVGNKVDLTKHKHTF